MEHETGYEVSKIQLELFKVVTDYLTVPVRGNPVTLITNPMSCYIPIQAQQLSTQDSEYVY